MKRLAISAGLRILLAAFSILVLFGCAGGFEGSVHVPPSFVIQPVNQTVASGLTTTFTAAVAGTGPFTFQWYRNSLAISGANSTSYTTPPVTPSDNGTTYTVTVSNLAGTITSAPVTLNVAAAALESIAVTPGNPSIAKGLTQQFVATGTYSDHSTQIITGTVTWASSATSAATIGVSSGLAVGAGTGMSQITATQGSVVSPAATLTVGAAVLESIAITPPGTSIAKGLTQQFVATGTYSDNSTQVITSSVTWASTTISVATIGPGTGLATAVNTGTSQITATQGSVVSPGVTVTVGVAILQSIAVTPTGASIPKGLTQQFVATGTYSDNSTQIITTSVTWGSVTSSVATIGANTGLAVGQNTGTSQITATQGAVVSPAVTLTVTVPILESIAVTPSGPPVPKGKTQQFVATGTYSDNSTQVLTGSVTWMSNNTSVATIGASTGLAAAVDLGTSQITATLGTIVSPSDTITVINATLQSIAVTPSGASVAKGLTQQFVATGTYSDNTTQILTTTATWASGTTSVATIGASTGLATTLATGTSQITATLGTVVSPPVTLTVTTQILESIAVTPGNTSVPDGETQQFVATGTYSDNSTQVLTTSVTWASSNMSTASIGTTTGLTTGDGTGTSQITATLNGVTSPPITLTITAPVLQSIAVTPVGRSTPKGLTQQFVATGTYSDNSTQAITTSVTWASGTTSVATIGTGTGLATAVNTGTSQITATQGSVVSPGITWTVIAPTLQSIAVTPVSPSVAKGLTQQFIATGTYSDNSTQVITTSVTWASATTSMATIGMSTGLATAVNTGTSQITATQGSVVSPGITLTVTPPTLQSIAVTPTTPSVAKGLTQQFVATGTYSDNSTQVITTSVTWASTSTSVATIGSVTGLASAVNAGTSQITATQGSIVSPGVTMTVIAATLQSIAVTPSAPSVVKGTTQQFVATGTYSDNSTQVITTSVTWASATTSVATIGASTGLATAVTTGTSQITATLGSVVSPNDTMTVINSTPVATSLVCNPTAPAFNASVSLTPTFSGGTGAIGSTGTGSSNITASAVSGSPYTTPTLTSSKTYTLTVTGTGGNTATTTCTATPTPVVISAIVPAGQTMGPGQQGFTAMVTGGATNSVTWSANGGSFSGNLWTSPNSAGTYTITATSVDNPSVTQTTTVIVSAPAITTEPVSQNVCTGGAVTLSVVANYAVSYQWKLGGTAITGATSSTLLIPNATSASNGNYTVTVTNPAGSVTSNIATAVVGSTITSNPASLSIFTTQTATFSVSVTGQSPFTYQWYEIPSGQTMGTAITGATSSSYTTPAVDSTYNGAQYYVAVTDACGGSAIDSTNATLTVSSGNVPPTITTQPTGQTVAVGGTVTLTVVASGTPTVTYQWFRVPAGSSTGSSISAATSASYTVPSSATTTGNDQDSYYVIATNSYGQAVSQKATIAVGNGILIQINNQPQTLYVNAGDSATFSVTASSSATLSYQWYTAAAGSSVFAAISGATSSTYTIPTTTASQTGSYYRVVVSNGGATSSVTSSSAALFVGAPSGVNNFCDSNWIKIGNAATESGCSFQLTAATTGQEGEIVWPTLVATGNIQLSFTIAVSNPSSTPADGFAMVLGDPSLGATISSTGSAGSGLGAEGIPGFVLGFDTYHNTGDPTVPYLGVGRGETALWENPWFNVNTNIPALATVGTTVTHNYVVSIVQGLMTVTMDGSQVFSGSVTVPPAAYLYVTASTGGAYEQTVISNLVANVSAPSN